MSCTLQDIANAAGVSTATVSRIINNSLSVKPETRENVLNIIKELNYVPNAVARSLSRNETTTIGVVVPDIMNPFFGKIVRGISTVLRNMDYNISMCDTDESVINEYASLQMLRKQQVRGLIITPTLEQEKTRGLELLSFQKSKIPVVVVDRDVNSSNFDGVFLDNVQAGIEATQAFINVGHRKIAAIMGPAESKASVERTLGYCNALQMNGLAINPDYILHGFYNMESGYEMTRALLALSDPPTAIFIGSSMLTHACIHALLEHNVKIPQEMGIIGFDEMSCFKPFGIHISYIERSVPQMGEAAAKLLIDRINTPITAECDRERKCIIIPPRLVLKGSELCFNK